MNSVVKTWNGRFLFCAAIVELFTVVEPVEDCAIVKVVASTAAGEVVLQIADVEKQHVTLMKDRLEAEWIGRIFGVQVM